MSEQDRYGSHLGVDPKKIPDKPTFRGSSGAEQDRYASHFEGRFDPKTVSDKFKGTSGAEQDRYGSHFEGKFDPHTVSDKFKGTSGAEQDRYGSHFEGKFDPHIVSDKFKGTSGAEQDRYGSHFEGKFDPKKVSDKFKGTSGAEQDRYGSHFYGVDAKALPDRSSFRGTSGAEQDRYASHFEGYGVDAKDLPNRSSFQGTSGAEQDRYSSHFGGHGVNAKSLPDKTSFRDAYESRFGVEQEELTVLAYETWENDTGSGLALFGKNSGGDSSGNFSLDTSTIGIFRSTILPSFGLHSGLAIIAYAVARSSDRLEVKDYLWPSAQIANAWWSAVGTKVVYDSVSISTALDSLTYTQKLLLGGVTVWGIRLLYRIASRGITRGKDDPRYDAVKKEPGFWNNAIYSIFLPEAIIQTIVSLPFVIPFRAPWASAAASPNLPVSAEIVHDLAIWLFGSGVALSIMADAQLAEHQEKEKESLKSKGTTIWDIVPHANYLGETLVHASFPILLAGAGLMHPVTLLGPAANYIFLRYFSVDKETEAKPKAETGAQDEQVKETETERKSLLDRALKVETPVRQLLAVVAWGAIATGVEQGFRRGWFPSSS